MEWTGAISDEAPVIDAGGAPLLAELDFRAGCRRSGGVRFPQFPARRPRWLAVYATWDAALPTCNRSASRERFSTARTRDAADPP